MLTSFIFFIISGLGLFGMLFLKQRELTTGESHPLTELTEKGDTVVRKGLITSIFLFRKYRAKAGYFLAFYLSQTVVIVERWVFAGIKWLNHKLEKVFQLIKGQVYPKSKGTVSFFLKHISEHKKNIQEERKINNDDISEDI